MSRTESTRPALKKITITQGFNAKCSAGTRQKGATIAFKMMWSLQNYDCI